MTARSAHSLRRRLLWLLLIAIGIAALIQAVIAYKTALEEADEIFDQQMQQVAASLRGGLPVAVEARRSESDSNEDNFDFVIQIWSADGGQLFESAPRAALPQLAVLGFSNVRARDTTYRVFSVQTPDQIIQIGQDMAARREIAIALALRFILPIALLAPLLMLVVWWVVTQSMRPLWRVRTEVAARAGDDFSPLAEEGLPEEVRPLVTELNHLFDRLKAAFEARQSFVANAAHELRSPLAALRVQAQSIERATDEPARVIGIRRLLSGVERATRLLDQMLALARHESQIDSELAARRVDLGEVVRLALADVLPHAHAREIDLGVHRADPIVVEGREESVRTLVRNLLDNAVKYTPEGGTVDVTLEGYKRGVAIVVEDSGPGIPPDDRERVFDRFYRGADSATHGSGLGLAIVRTIAQQHGGTVTLDRSERLGGLMVRCEFPEARGS